MSRTFSRTKILAALGVAAFLAGYGVALGAGTVIQDQAYGDAVPGYISNNYYVQPYGYEGAGAQLYLCPRPTPPFVGHTYITYPPLAPHEMMYHHHRVYRTAHPDAPPTRTSVHWGSFLSFRLSPKYSLTPFRLVY